MLAATVSSSPDRTRGVPPLDACALVGAGVYRLGDDRERVVELEAVLIGRWPVTTRHFREFVEATSREVGGALRPRLEAEQLADHPIAEVSFADAHAFCAWAAAELGRPVRLPSGDEWEAAARGAEGRVWPWGEVFGAERCNSVESGWGWTVPVRAHPEGAAAGGAEQLAGNVWEWVGDPADEHGWRTVRGGSYLDTSWGVRCARALPADPERPTATTGFRIAIEERGQR
ncbi:MAG TPA: SUMF1/EgtB/PvdO family nonheme iron enzyme [Solirubrobacteraceae bacterium]|nr:SUMF1/EgtB/PvdO family nonheme iron enzyme [Solirubrobacteraceae bacterium]